MRPAGGTHLPLRAAGLPLPQRLPCPRATHGVPPGACAPALRSAQGRRARLGVPGSSWRPCTHPTKRSPRSAEAHAARRPTRECRRSCVPVRYSSTVASQPPATNESPAPKEPPAANETPTATGKPNWWQRRFRKRAVTSPESDGVATARLSRTTTIATTAITALLGLGGSIATAAVSCDNTGRQLASDREKSTTEFLRNQRRTAYSAFATEANISYLALLDANNLVGPKIPLPTPEVFDKTSLDLRNHLGNVNAAAFNVELVASEEVCEAASHENRALWDAAGDHFWRAISYIKNGKSLDSDYATIWMTVDQINKLRDMFIHFIKVAREDVNDSSLRPPGKDCPKPSWRQ